MNETKNWLVSAQMAALVCELVFGSDDDRVVLLNRCVEEMRRDMSERRSIARLYRTAQKIALELYRDDYELWELWDSYDASLSDAERWNRMDAVYLLKRVMWSPYDRLYNLRITERATRRRIREEYREELCAD